MKKFVLLVTIASLILSLSVAFAGKPASVTPTVKNVFVDGRFGEFCTDPQAWVDAGYSVGVWGNSVPFKAQATDDNGHLVQGNFNFNVLQTGESGLMNVVDSANLEYQFSPNVPQGITYDVTVSAGGVSGSGNIFREAAKCDTCHTTPPGHIADPANWGKCHDCHNLGEVMHKHAYNKGGIVTDCYSCHPTGCLDTDIHKANYNMSCTDCHGDLSQTVTGTFKISGMAGKPNCADCHDANHSEPQLRDGTRQLFVDSNGHGKARGAKLSCSSCHGAPHRIEKPNFDVGLGNNCSGCHTTQANNRNMGPNCGTCHGSSTDPHLVKK